MFDLCKWCSSQTNLDVTGCPVVSNIFLFFPPEISLSEDICAFCDRIGCMLIHQYLLCGNGQHQQIIIFGKSPDFCGEKYIDLLLPRDRLIFLRSLFGLFWQKQHHIVYYTWYRHHMYTYSNSNTMRFSQSSWPDRSPEQNISASRQ
jgi:hypothetical protein